jgi:hypothetical protein
MFFCLRKKTGKRQRTESKITGCNSLYRRVRESVPPLKSGMPIAGTQRQPSLAVVPPFCHGKVAKIDFPNNSGGLRSSDR